jgi:glycosidase
MYRRPILLFCMMIALAFSANAKISVTKLSPSSWYTNLPIDTVFIVVEGQNLTMAKVTTTYPGVYVAKTTPTLNPKFISLELVVSKEAKAGVVKLDFWEGGSVSDSYNFPLKNRPILAQMPISPADVIYQIVPDRFSNGNFTNDNVKGMMELADPLNPSGIHGGDIAGLSNKLTYLAKLGITAVELTPVLESNQYIGSYDHWSVTDHYKIDPRLGTEKEFVDYIAKSKAMGIKTICTFVFNQMGKYNALFMKPTFPNWFIPDQGIYLPVQPNAANIDSYASYADQFGVMGSWPDQNTIALNVDEPNLQRYLVQNCIWWIATTGLDGIKIDKSYSLGTNFLQLLVTKVSAAFPSLTIITDFESNQHHFHAKWLMPIKAPFILNGDYTMASALENAFSDYNDPTSGLNLAYNALASDYCLPNAYQNILFADNHKLNRAFSNADKDLQQLKLMLAIVFASRGIPQITYGTEALIDGVSSNGLGFVRKDFPGLKDSDSPNTFTNLQTTAQQNHISTYIKQLIEWRKNCDAAQWGKLVHYSPADGLYLFFRHSEKQHIMVIINNHPTEKKRLETMRYINDIGNANTAIDMLTKQAYNPIDNIIVSPKTALILELIEKPAL